jgi:hypothetical protein
VNSNLVIAAAILVLVVAVAFVIGRYRVGDWDVRRDGIVLVAIAVMGLFAVLVVAAPRPVALVLFSMALLLGGTYILLNADATEALPPGRRIMVRVAGAGALVLGLFGLVATLIRPPS